jgi:hypothetical protein
MQLKAEWPSGAKNKGEPFRPTLIPLRALARRSGRFPPLPCPPPRLLKCSIPDQQTEKPFDFCDGVDSPLWRANPCGSLPARGVPLTWLLWPGVFLIMERLGVPQDDRRDFIGVGRTYARARTRPTVRGRPRRDGLRHGRTQKRTTEQTSRRKIVARDRAEADCQYETTAEPTNTREPVPEKSLRSGLRRPYANTSTTQALPSETIRRDRP